MKQSLAVLARNRVSRRSEVIGKVKELLAIFKYRRSAGARQKFFERAAEHLRCQSLLHKRQPIVLRVAPRSCGIMRVLASRTARWRIKIVGQDNGFTKTEILF